MKTRKGSILTKNGWVDGVIEFNEQIQSVIGDITQSPAAPYIIPGFVDLHVHGGFGFDMMDGEQAILGAAKFHLGHGTTSILATSLTAPIEDIERFLMAVGEITKADQYQNGGNAPAKDRSISTSTTALVSNMPAQVRQNQTARILGAHLEGPFVNPNKLGAQPPFALVPSIAIVDKWCAMAPVVAITMAPEMDEGHTVTRHLQSQNVKVQIGHSLCAYCEAAALIQAGCGITHLYNAMSGIAHRGNGIAGAALAHAEFAEIIPDLIHVEAGAILAARRAIPKLYGVTDATAGAGMEDGEFMLGQNKVYKNGNKMTLKDGTLAGSVLTMDQALRNLVSIGIPLREAIERLSTIPADWIGRSDIGRLEIGAFADIVVLDDALEIVEVFVGGAIFFTLRNPTSEVNF